MNKALQFDVVTLFPPMFDAISKFGITARALENKIYELALWNPRDFTTDNHRTVDDRPYGGGPGMVMLAEPLEKTINAAKTRQQQAGVVTRKWNAKPPRQPTLRRAGNDALSSFQAQAAGDSSLRS